MKELLHQFLPENPNEFRRTGGNNNYLLSNIRQWLNSDLNEWYTASHVHDKPPSAGYLSFGIDAYVDRPGFMTNLSQNLKKSIKNTNLKTSYGYYDEGSGEYSHTDKVFLLSRIELTGVGNSEGRHFLALEVGDRLLGYILGDWVKKAAYFTRSPYDAGLPGVPSSNSTSYISEGGFYVPNSQWNEPAIGLAVRPALNVDKDLPVSDFPDSEGIYTLTFNEAPIISGSNIDLGEFTENIIAHNYSVTDLEDDPVTVIEKLGNTILRTHTPVLGETSTLTISEDQWLRTPNGKQTIAIVASDGKLSATRTLTFTRKVTPTTVLLESPAEVEERPSRLILKSTGYIAPGASITVEVCNNGLDDTPTWEDVTEIINSGQIYFFTNTTKTAESWAFDIRVTMDRGTAEANSWLQSLSGNFDSVGV